MQEFLTGSGEFDASVFKHIFANIKCLLGRNADEAQESLKTCGSRNYVAVAALDTIASNGGCYGMEPLFTDTNAITVHKTPQRLL